MGGWAKAGVVLAVTIGVIHGLLGLAVDSVMDLGTRESRLVRWRYERWLRTRT